MYSVCALSLQLVFLVFSLLGFEEFFSASVNGIPILMFQPDALDSRFATLVFVPEVAVTVCLPILPMPVK